MTSASLERKIVITIILSVLFYVLFAVFSDIGKLAEYYQKIRIVYIIPIFGILSFSIFLRSLLQRFLLKKIGIELSVKQSLSLFWAGLSMLITPGGSGQIIKSHIIEKRYGYPISKSLPLVFTERFCDFTALFMIILTSMLFLYSLESIIVLSISLLLILVMFLLVKNRIFFNLVKTLVTKIPVLKKIFEQTSPFETSLQKLFEIKTIVKGVLVAIVTFSIEGFVVYLCFLAFGIDLGYFKTIQIFYTSVLSGTLSFLPAGTGILEGSFVKLMLDQNFVLARVSSLVIFIRMTITWFPIAIGFLVFYSAIRKRVQNTS